MTTPTEVDALIGDVSKARDRLGWGHTMANWLAQVTVDADMVPMARLLQK